MTYGLPDWEDLWKEEHEECERLRAENANLLARLGLAPKASADPDGLRAFDVMTSPKRTGRSIKLGRVFASSSRDALDAALQEGHGTGRGLRVVLVEG